MSRNAVFMTGGAWLALLSLGDLHHFEAKRLLQQLQERDCDFITSSAVVLEVGDGLASRDLRQASWLFLALLDAPKVEVVMIDAIWLDLGWKFFDADPNLKWSFTDCLSFAIMREFDLLDAFTHNRHFEQAGFRALLRQP